MRRRMFLSCLFALGCGALVAQQPPNPVALESIAVYDYNIVAYDKNTGNYTIAGNSIVIGTPNVKYNVMAMAVDSNGVEWWLDGPLGPGLPDNVFVMPANGAAFPFHKWTVPFGNQHLVNKQINNKGYADIRVKLYQRTDTPGGGFADKLIMQAEGKAYIPE